MRFTTRSSRYYGEFRIINAFFIEYIYIVMKIEKSNKPFHIQPVLYNDIRKYVEHAYRFDFNFVIEMLKIC